MSYELYVVSRMASFNAIDTNGIPLSRFTGTASAMKIKY